MTSGIEIQAGAEATSRTGMDSEAHALRRYVSARAAGRTAPKWVRADYSVLPGSAVWVACTEVEAAGRSDGRYFRQVRRDGLPWCEWLGQDTRIAEDHPLQAFFQLYTADRKDWNRLSKEADRNRRKALREWRRKGYEAINRIRWEQVREAQGDGIDAESIRLPAVLPDEFRIRGKGVRSLKKS